VLHTLTRLSWKNAWRIGKSELPALCGLEGPFMRIENLPYLGTGKLDLRKSARLALEMTQRTLHE